MGGDVTRGRDLRHVAEPGPDTPTRKVASGGWSRSHRPGRDVPGGARTSPGAPKRREELASGETERVWTRERPGAEAAWEPRPGRTGTAEPGHTREGRGGRQPWARSRAAIGKKLGDHVVTEVARVWSLSLGSISL